VTDHRFDGVPVFARPEFEEEHARPRRQAAHAAAAAPRPESAPTRPARRPQVNPAAWRAGLAALVFAVVLLGGCDPGPSLRAADRPAQGATGLTKLVGDVSVALPIVYRFRDVEFGVTCWTTTEGGIFCLPDPQVRRAP
jgi:hypothetical protein